MNDSIFRPNYNITSQIEFNLDNIDRNRWLIERVLLIPKHQAWLRREVRIGRAASTTRIEGGALDQEAVAQLEREAVSRSADPDEQDNINALGAYDFIDFVSDQADIPVDELVIRQINRLFIATAAPTPTPGVYRKGQNHVGAYQPPDRGDVPGLMRSFALWLREDNTELHPVLKAGIAHLHLVAVHPFWDGNGRTARGLETLLLQRSDFGFRKLLQLEFGLSQIRDEYFDAIRGTLGARYEGGYDLTSWLEFSTQVMGAASSRLVAGMTDWHRTVQELYDQGAVEGLLPRQIDGHLFAMRTGRITRGDYLEITGVSPATASRDLADLVARGYLAMEGKTRSRIYRPIPLDGSSGSQVPQEQLPPLSG